MDIANEKTMNIYDLTKLCEDLFTWLNIGYCGVQPTLKSGNNPFHLWTKGKAFEAVHDDEVLLRDAAERSSRAVSDCSRDRWVSGATWSRFLLRSSGVASSSPRTVMQTSSPVWGRPVESLKTMDPTERKMSGCMQHGQHQIDFPTCLPHFSTNWRKFGQQSVVSCNLFVFRLRRVWEVGAERLRRWQGEAPPRQHKGGNHPSDTSRVNTPLLRLPIGRVHAGVLLQQKGLTLPLAHKFSALLIWVRCPNFLLSRVINYTWHLVHWPNAELPLWSSHGNQLNVSCMQRRGVR